MNYNLITILGPTATGKTSLAAKLAHEFNGEIISADSRQVYKGMDLGTGKDLKDYELNGTKIPYHLIDVLDPKDEFNLFEFVKLFNKAFDEINSKNKFPFLVGGTGLYLDSILRKYDLKQAEFDEEKFKELEKIDTEILKEKLIQLKPGQHNTTDFIDRYRLIKAILIAEAENKIPQKEINSLNIGISAERKIIKERITKRLKQRLSEGMIEEVEQLLQNGVTFEKLNYFGLEYKFVGLYLKGELNKNDMYQKLNSAIHDFAKRQMTWFRRMEKNGVKIYWIESGDYEKARQIILKNLPQIR